MRTTESQILKFLTIFVILISFTGIFTSCEREYYKPVTISQTDSIHFSTDIKPILATNCGKSGCHDAAKKEKGLNFEATDSYLTISDYSLVDTINPEQSLLYVKINSGTMKPYSNPEFTAKILLWIKQGSLEN